ncbi:hypothetical protein MATL_G00251130 [Megalops atlanticus]|uniref:Ig-like domain-containing protein n=1 Tax=Megalops atlanticus TaxID=7932 RepID=A0A9D3PFW4_MEGAT|nr:hypothetical protein MATL_G00251130 [Megalops atlanticus]
MTRLYPVIFLLSVVICTKAQAPHKGTAIVGCSEDDAEATMLLDGNELLYEDYKAYKEVMTLPEFADAIPSPGLLHSALRGRDICKDILQVAKIAENDQPEAVAPPDSLIYPKNYAELGKENTLICSMNHFYPPAVKVKWTKNDIEVKEGVTLGRYYPNNDGTFNQFSTLSFTPEEGDIYTCTVEHKALTEPLTRIWEPEVSPQAGVGATVFSGVGLTVGLLGVATGTFFFIKGNNCN